MNLAAADAIVRATLYEGYALYPYRKSSLKNRQRWSFGGLEPGGPCLRAECLFVGEAARLLVQVRFLHLADRDGWQEAVERCIELSLGPDGHVEHRFEQLPDVPPPLRQERVRGRITVRCQPLDGAQRVSVVVENESEPGPLSVLASTHVLLGCESGRFLSLTDPPTAYVRQSAACQNQGCWPVLVGPAGDDRLVLASPIILPDHPEVAPESPGDLFDGTEIDEILSLRILTLTDEEKREARATDARVAALLDRVEALGPGELSALHGRLRQPSGPRPFRAGDRVRLRPRGRADAFDLLLDGRSAIVIEVQVDVDDRVHLMVAVDDDPGRDLALAGRPGHRFFFSPEEVERL